MAGLRSLPLCRASYLARTLSFLYVLDMEENEKTAPESPHTDPMAQKALIINGFSREETFMIVDTIKKTFGKGHDIIFAMTTRHSITRPLVDILTELSEDHAFMKKNPPGPGKNPF